MTKHYLNGQIDGLVVGLGGFHGCMHGWMEACMHAWVVG